MPVLDCEILRLAVPASERQTIRSARVWRNTACGGRNDMSEIAVDPDGLDDIATLQSDVVCGFSEDIRTWDGRTRSTLRTFLDEAGSQVRAAANTYRRTDETAAAEISALWHSDLPTRSGTV
jgi:hypothetical protein